MSSNHEIILLIDLDYSFVIIYMSLDLKYYKNNILNSGHLLKKLFQYITQHKVIKQISY